MPVYKGNVVSSASLVTSSSHDTAAWCLAMLDLDCSKMGEVLHWLVGNITNSDLRTGQTLCQYLQPLPAFGTYTSFLFNEGRAGL